MVAKISTGGNMFGALAYNQNKVDSEEAKVLFSKDRKSTRLNSSHAKTSRMPSSA